MVQEYCDADVWPLDVPPSHDEVLERITKVEGLISLLTERIDARIPRKSACGLDVQVHLEGGPEAHVDGILEARTSGRYELGRTPHHCR